MASSNLPLPCFFQDDKDLVHEFVVAEGLTCLIKVGAEADQNYQNYILRGTPTLKPLLPFSHIPLIEDVVHQRCRPFLSTKTIQVQTCLRTSPKSMSHPDAPHALNGT